MYSKLNQFPFLNKNIAPYIHLTSSDHFFGKEEEIASEKEKLATQGIFVMRGVYFQFNNRTIVIENIKDLLFFNSNITKNSDLHKVVVHHYEKLLEINIENSHDNTHINTFVRSSDPQGENFQFYNFKEWITGLDNHKGELSDLNLPLNMKINHKKLSKGYPNKTTGVENSKDLDSTSKASKNYYPEIAFSCWSRKECHDPNPKNQWLFDIFFPFLYAKVCRVVSPLDFLLESSKKGVITEKKYRGHLDQVRNDKSVFDVQNNFTVFQGYPDLLAEAFRADPLVTQLGLSTRASQTLPKTNLTFSQEGPHHDHWLSFFGNSEFDLQIIDKKKRTSSIFNLVALKWEAAFIKTKQENPRGFGKNNYAQDQARFQVPAAYMTSFAMSFNSNLHELQLIERFLNPEYILPLNPFEIFRLNENYFNNPESCLVSLNKSDLSPVNQKLFSEFASLLLFIQRDKVFQSQLQQPDQTLESSQERRLYKREGSLAPRNIKSMKGTFKMIDKNNIISCLNVEGDNLVLLELKNFVKTNVNQVISKFIPLVPKEKDHSAILKVRANIDSEVKISELVEWAAMLENHVIGKSGKGNWEEFLQEWKQNHFKFHHLSIENLEINCSWAAARDFITHKNIFKKKVQQSTSEISTTIFVSKLLRKNVNTLDENFKNKDKEEILDEARLIDTQSLLSPKRLILEGICMEELHYILSLRSSSKSHFEYCAVALMIPFFIWESSVFECIVKKDMLQDPYYNKSIREKIFNFEKSYINFINATIKDYSEAKIIVQLIDIICESRRR